MPEVHTHCDGCGEEILEGEKDIVIVIKGSSELHDDDMLVGWDNQLWFGHDHCHDKPLMNAQTFLQGIVFQELNSQLRMEMLKGKLEQIFERYGWPTGGE